MAVTESPLSNAAIADALDELGDLYELDGAIVHRVLAYRAAAKAVREASVSVAALALAGRASELPGIGKTLQEKILALAQTGAIPAAERLRAKFPPGLIAITRLPGLGPKRARLLHSELGVDSLQALRDAALAQRLRTVRGVGPKLEESVLGALAELDANPTAHASARVVLPRALEIGQELVAGLTERAGDDAHIELAGSIRRQADSVKDIDIIATTTRLTTLAKSLSKLEQIERVSSAGKAGAKGRTHSGMGVDLRIAAPSQLGNLLQHFTGSGPHNAALREAAVRAGLHVSEYGILDDSTGATDTYETEHHVYQRLGLSYIDPELRENRGELQAARGGTLPRLIELTDIRGDLHSHTIASDGHNTIEEMALAARDRGYEYLAITDHSASHGFGNDVSPEQLRRQIELIREVNTRVQGIELLAGSEVNVLPDGSLDYEDELLGELDWIVASVHTSFGMSEQAMTERMITAVEHPLVDAIGHPTGRLIERREPYAIDLDAVFTAAARTRTMLEINANPDRRDLSEVPARAAVRAGVMLVIDSDAHRTSTLANMRWGVATARRAWLQKHDVANTCPWPELAQRRKRAS
ncbi:MAG TPA: DNA polymerase/3'-5' exonuclease PolX [Solirubrobacteraceae bacterium]|jgi:DNA polymerase (family 10)|nr:DNA polymerase/3'-5' exonuclease PolX [Solirubrobacteraceae bacterium]